MTRGSAEAKYAIDKFQGIGPAISPGVAIFPTELVGIGATQPGVWSYWGGQTGFYTLSFPSGSSPISAPPDDGVGGLYATGLGNLYRASTVVATPIFYTAGPLTNYVWLAAYGFGVIGLWLGAGDQLINFALGDQTPSPPSVPTATVSANPSSTLAAGTYRVVSLYTTQSSGGLSTVFQMGVTATFTVAANQQVVVTAGSPGRYYLQRTDIIEPYLRFIGAVGDYSPTGLLTTITSDPPLQSVFIMGSFATSGSFSAQYNGRAFYHRGLMYSFGPHPTIAGLVSFVGGGTTQNNIVYSDAGYSNFSLGSNILTPKSNKGYGSLTGMAGNATGLYIAWPGELHQIQSDFVIGGRYQETEPLEPIGSDGVAYQGINKTLVSVGNTVYSIFKGRVFEIRGGSIGEISQPVYPSIITSGSPFQYLEYDVASGDIVAGTGAGTLFRYNLFTKQWMNDISLGNPYFYRNAKGLVVNSSLNLYNFGTGAAPYVAFRNLDLGAPSQRKSIEGVECFIDGATTSTVILDITIDGVSTTVNGIKRGTSSWFFRLPGKIGQLINYMRIRLNGQPAVQMRPPLIIHFSSSQELGY